MFTKETKVNHSIKECENLFHTLNETSMFPLECKGLLNQGLELIKKSTTHDELNYIFVGTLLYTVEYYDVVKNYYSSKLGVPDVVKEVTKLVKEMAPQDNPNKIVFKELIPAIGRNALKRETIPFDDIFSVNNTLQSRISECFSKIKENSLESQKSMQDEKTLKI